MAWSLTIAGVDRTHKILNVTPPRLTINVNERATAHFACHPSFEPQRFDDVVITYDGTNPAFRGLVLHRTIVPIADEKVPYRTDVDCIDYGATADWVFATLNYPSPVTLKQVLSDLCATQLGAFGITLDPTQTVGPTLAPFAWNNKRVSDCLRELMDRTGYVYGVGPYRTLGAELPGQQIAALSITDAAPHIKSLSWTDPDGVPTNYLVVTCGPAGGAYQPYQPAYDIVADGVATYWKIPGPVPGVLSSIPWTPEGGSGSLKVDGYVRHCFVGFEEFIWNETTTTLSVGSAPVPTAGQHLTFQRNFQYPFTVIADGGVTPRIAQLVSAPDVMAYEPAQELADGLLSQLNQQPRKLRVVSTELGWIYATGNLVQIDLTGRMRGSAVITGMTIEIRAQRHGDPLWIFDMDAQENADAYQGSVLDQWRTLLKGGNLDASSSSAISVIAGTPAFGAVALVAPTSPNRLTKWANANTLTDSRIWEPGANQINIDGRVFAVDPDPFFALQDTDAPADHRVWLWHSQGNGDASFQWVPDDFSSVGTVLILKRSGDVLVGSTLTAAALAGNGAAITALNATNLTSGTVPDACFPAILPAVSGANLTNLNASQITTGTLPDARLSANIPRLNAASNVFTGTLQAASLGTTPLDATQLTGTINNARIQVSTPSRLLGRGSSSAGAMQEITLGTGLAMTGTTLSASGGGGAGADLLDYVGPFVTGPAYHDGDIVIGADGIAYLCVVEGTTTPPEPWPGTGIITSVGPPGPAGPAGPPGPSGVNAAVDASYWTATPHATLTNERALSSLANGYVKSTAGEPSTVATIPVADGGTGATTASTARTNLGCGNVATAVYSGDPSTFLRGDGAWINPAQQLAVIPSGMVAIFLGAGCPPGWTRVAGFDGVFLRGAPVAGPSGGSASHSHGPGTLAAASHAHGAGTLAGPNHNHGGSISVPITIFGTTNARGDHNHSATLGGASDSRWVQTGTGSGGNYAVDYHTHNVAIANSGTHTHDLGASTTGTGNIPNDGGQGVSGSTAAAAAAVSGTTDAASNLPPFGDVLYCMKN